jgi:formylglycine-generating enzyme required for sulfatase activity
MNKLLTIFIISLFILSPVYADNQSADILAKNSKHSCKFFTKKQKVLPDFLPISENSNIEIGYTTVTNSDYSKFIRDTGKAAPQSWKNSVMPKKKGNFPVTQISYYDALEYCAWLSKKDGSAVYRLPTEEEWEMAAGQIPDANFNSGENKGLTPVTAYKKTLSASGAIDMWGNVWEWTSTPRINAAGKYSTILFAVKGGAWNSSVTNCRTDYRNEARNPDSGYDNVGFRIVRVK